MQQTVRSDTSLGQQVAVLVEGEHAAGFHEVRFDAEGLAGGIYFYTLRTGSFTATRKLILLK